MNVLWRLNNFLLPQDLANQGLLPKTPTQLGAAPGRKGVIFALEGVLAESSLLGSYSFQRLLTQQLSSALNLLLITTSSGNLGSFSPTSGTLTNISRRRSAQQGPSLLHGACLLPCPGSGGKIKHHLLQ